jgi:hypothetical protein
MRFLGAQGILATTVGVLALSACRGGGDLPTDLRPEGPPEVLAVMVLTDQLSANEGLLDESAAFCKIDNGVPDPKDPTILGLPDQSVAQICPETAAEVTGGFSHRPLIGDPKTTVGVSNANPIGLGGFYVRVVFDELLDPSFETLTDSEDGGPCTADSITCDGHIAMSMPVTLTCDGVDILYDGYYVPNGNKVSYPPGPSIVVIPEDFVGAEAECTITLKDLITDKEGNSVPAEQRGTSAVPYTFSVSSMILLGSSPAEGEEITNDSPVFLTFSSFPDMASLDAADVTVVGPTGANIAVDLSADATDVVVLPTSGTWPVLPCDTATPPAACSQACDAATPCPANFDCLVDSDDDGEPDTCDDLGFTLTLPATATITDLGGASYIPDGDFVLDFTAVAP